MSEYSHFSNINLIVNKLIHTFTIWWTIIIASKKIKVVVMFIG